MFRFLIHCFRWTLMFLWWLGNLFLLLLDMDLLFGRIFLLFRQNWLLCQLLILCLLLWKLRFWLDHFHFLQCFWKLEDIFVE